ncbi:SgcJ/EcaC family oxidoreductase [Agromyces sp. NPDC058484]|uniref:SgcJ/EcaC family oxidoreductase n=1 Tax=Agromyces sp. NPDC058484 TaxID=3346524 RepID=UPI003669272D
MSATRDRGAVTAVIASLIEAWANHDADGYGAHFTEDATYVTFVGTYYRGRNDIVQAHRHLFEKFLGDTKLADEVLDVRFIGSDAVVVTSLGDTYKGAAPRKLDKVQTYTLVREADGQWRIAAFQNTKRRRVMERIQFRFAPGTIPAEQR